MKRVLWLARGGAMLDRNRCCSLAHTGVAMAKEARHWLEGRHRRIG